jgi:hypothetical protein
VKKVVGLVLLAGAAYLGWHWLTARGAYKAYEGFAEAWAQEKRAVAAQYGDDAAVRHAFEEKPLRGNAGGNMMEAFRGTRYAVESKKRSEDGDFVFVVSQTIFFDPPGVTSGIGGAMYAHYRDEATVRKTDDGWRVVAFEPAYLEMKEIRRGR